jgi:NADPH:quinone reductase-like Zn-dependent oxidoreductase
MTAPATELMWAIRQHAFGPAEVLRYERVPRPVPRPTEVLVRVHASGVNPVDWKTRAGKGYLRSLPLTVGWDISGEVVQTGPGVTRFQPGDQVFGMPRFPDEAAGYAEYVTAPSRQLARKPARLSHPEAAGLPLAGLTAWQALVDTAQVGAGDRVAVTSAGGGVGHLAVQIAKALGAHVTALARADKHPALRQLGADEVIDYQREDAVQRLRGCDLVLDTFGGPDSLRWVPVLRPGGLLLPLTGATPALVDAAARHGVRATGLLVEPDGAGLAALAALVDQGRLRVLLHTQLTLPEAATAHRIGEQGRALGKIVLTP